MKPNQSSTNEKSNTLETYFDFWLSDTPLDMPDEVEQPEILNDQYESDTHKPEADLEVATDAGKINQVLQSADNKPEATTKSEAITKSETTTQIESEEEDSTKWNALLQTKNQSSPEETSIDSEPNQVQQHESNNLQIKHKPVALTTSELSLSLPAKEPDERLASVAELLAKISVATQSMPQAESKLESIAATTTHTAEQVELEIDDENEIKIKQEAEEASFILRQTQRTRDIVPEVFQTLIFQVDNMPLAVPLLKLGGIVNIIDKKITPLVGSPNWFLGLIPSERGNLMVIDTHKYLMPERSIAPQDKKEYEYLIVLDDTNWALACHNVGDAKNLTSGDIRWSEKKSNRAWFGGVVVEYMSALIEVDELINMLAENIIE